MLLCLLVGVHIPKGSDREMGEQHNIDLKMIKLITPEGQPGVVTHAWVHADPAQYDCRLRRHSHPTGSQS